MSDDDAPELKGKIKDKLIRSKQEWAKQGRLITGRPDLGHVSRLPPGQREVQNWPVLDLGVQPQVAKEQWKLDIGGRVANPVTWSFADLMAQPQTEIVSDVHCVTAWSRYDNKWQGVSARHILDVVKPLPDAKHVIFTSYDGYTTNVTLAAFADANVLLAHTWEGKPLPAEHGGPVRVVIPDWYFWKSAKWVKRIEFGATDKPGFWEVRGYHNEGDPWREERYG